MKIIISPAKKMRVDTDTMPVLALPVFLNRTEEILARLKSLSPAELQSLWKCNDQIAALNIERLREMNLHACLTPAVLAYDGIQYVHMAPSVFTDQEFLYVQEHLRILSGFYGVLRPFDGVTPYRLEMQSRLAVGSHRDLYAFWGDALARELCTGTDCILNLASKEYSQCISKHLPSGVRFITCVFAEWKDGKLIEKGTQCKMARGEMVRYLAEQQADVPEAAQSFSRLGFAYSPAHSDSSTYVFIKA